jgi:hypothetical protein
VVVLAALIAGFIYWRGGESRRLRAEAAEAAERLGCSDIQELRNEGREHLGPGEPPPNYGTTPGTSGKHGGGPLPPDPSVYDQPFDENLEAQAIHNLEHGYVLIYYRQDGDAALAENVVDALAELANGENKVLMAPYPELPEGRSLALAAWTRLQTCPTVTDADGVLAIASGFISQFRGGGEAPEPSAP